MLLGPFTRAFLLKATVMMLRFSSILCCHRLVVSPLCSVHVFAPSPTGSREIGSFFLVKDYFTFSKPPIFNEFRMSVYFLQNNRPRVNIFWIWSPSQKKESSGQSSGIFHIYLSDGPQKGKKSTSMKPDSGF